MWTRSKWLMVVFVFALVAAACSSGDSGSTETTTAEAGGSDATTTTAVEPHEEVELTIEAPTASITVDGDPADWSSIEGVDVTLEPIEEELSAGLENHDATIKMAHDDTNAYVLLTVDDDYNWNPENPKLSSAVAFMFNVQTGGPHMGGDDEEGDHSTGTVDVWHWELNCGPGELSGGAADASGSVTGTGDDKACNLDDEWAQTPEERGDDDTATAENSILGSYSHSNPVEDGAGEWYFEFSRPLQTGDEQDGQLTIGEPAEIAMAYWDSDNSDDGWDGDQHIQTASGYGWITVNFG